MSNDSVVIAAIEEAVNSKSNYNVRVINLSLGRPILRELYARSALPGGRGGLEERDRGGHRGG